MASLEYLLPLLTNSNQNNSGKRCPKCQEKEGDLYVLPSRMSIIGYTTDSIKQSKDETSDFQVPSLPKFAQKMVENLPLQNSKYCIQMLRQGYLYVLEHRNTGKQWRVFTSSPEGCLIEHDDVSKVSNIPPTYTCNIALDRADASYISFKESKNIIKIYFIFSPDKVSDDILASYQDKDLYLLNGITPDEIRNGTKSLLPDDFSPNILEFSVVEKLGIQEQFLKSKPYGEFTFFEKTLAKKEQFEIDSIYRNYTCFHDISIMQYYNRYLSIYKKLKKYQGAAIVVNDAIGITQSLNNFRHQALEKEMKPWMEKKDEEGISNEYRLMILRQLYGLRESFYEKRIKQKINKQNQYYDFLRAYNNRPYVSDFAKVISNSKIAENKEFYDKNVEKEYTKELSDKEFKEKYWNRISQEKIDKFEATFDKKCHDADKKSENFSQDYTKWLKSEQLLLALDLYDPDKPLDGIMFTMQVGACVNGTSSSPIIRKELDSLWSETQITRANICWRAYAFNNQSLINDINEYIALQEDAIITDSPVANGNSSQVDTAVNLLNKLTDHITKTGPIIDQLAQRGLPIAFLTTAFADLVRHFLQVTTTKFEQKIHNRFGNLILASIKQEAREMYRLGYNINGKKFSALPSRGAGQLTHIASENFRNADLTNTRIAMIVLGFGVYDTAQKIIQGRWKNAREKAELVASVMTSVASTFQLFTSVIEHCIGNNTASKTAIVTYNAFGRLFLWGASLASIAGGMSAIFDFMDGYGKQKKGLSAIAIAYYARAMATLLLSLSQFLVALRTLSPWLKRIIDDSIKKTIWVRIAQFSLFLGRLAAIRGVAIALGMINFYATFIIIAVSVVIVIFDDNALQKWLDRCCFSKNVEHKKFDDLTEELTEFHQAIQETF